MTAYTQQMVWLAHKEIGKLNIVIKYPRLEEIGFFTNISLEKIKILTNSRD